LVGFILLGIIGFLVGCFEGMNLTVDGLEVGTFVDLTVVGALVRVLVVGLAVGDEVGILDGTLVEGGWAVGTLEGLAVVGLMVGALKGLAVSCRIKVHQYHQKGSRHQQATRDGVKVKNDY